MKRNIEIIEKVEENSSDYLEVKLRYPIISGLENKSIEGKLNAMFKEEVLKLKELIETEAKSQYEEFQKDKTLPFMKYGVNTDYTVTYNKNDILTIKSIYYQFTGGAHGSAYQVGYNINLKTGEIRYFKVRRKNRNHKSYSIPWR